MKRLIFLTAITAIPCFSLHAAPQPPTSFNSYDGVEPGARPLGMGLSYCTVSNDPSAIYYNPAGIYAMEGNFLSISYEIARQSGLEQSDLFKLQELEGRSLNFIGVVSAKGAFSYRPLANKITKTTNGTDWESKELKINQYTLTVTAKEGQAVTGLNLSYLTGRLGLSGVSSGVPYANIADGDGVTSDLGFIYGLSDEFRFGLNLKNLLGYMWWDDYEAEQLPLFVRAGISFQITDFLVFATDWEKRYYRKGSGAEDISHFGLEQKLGQILSVEAGLYGSDLNDKEQIHYTAGLTYRKSSYEFSLAGEKYRQDNSDVMRYIFSLNIPM